MLLKNVNEREQIQKQIQELNNKRKLYILDHKKENANGLENALTKAIKEQAKKKKYSLELKAKMSVRSAVENLSKL